VLDVLRLEFETALRLAGCPNVASARRLAVAGSPGAASRDLGRVAGPGADG
jgi:4-hydroxymandelate oxidase